MDFTGRIETVGKDFATGEYIVDLRVKQDVTKIFDTVKNCKELDITIKKRRKRRSLDANAYYWQLLAKVAEELKVSKPFAHNCFLRKYGQIALFEKKAAYIVIPDTEEAEKQVDEAEMYHLKPTSQVKEGKDGVMYRTYLMLRGSSDYNTKEMSVLIDGLVSDAKELGIETLPPAELERMKREWGIEAEQKSKNRLV